MAEPAKDPKKPPKGETRDIPITSFSGIDRVEQVNSVLRSLEYGNFGIPSQFVDVMLRDDRIRGDLWTRINGLLGSPVEIKAPHGKRKARKIAELVGGDDEHAGLYGRMYPDDIIAGLLLWGLMVGIGVVEVIWDTSGEQAIPRCKLWHPQFLQWRWDTRSYWLTTEDGMVELPDTTKRQHSDARWIIYTPFGYRYGWFHGHLRSLGALYIDRQWVRRDWSRRNEVHGLPIRKAIVPQEAEEGDKFGFYQSLYKAGSEMVAMCPRNEAGVGYDVQLVEAMANNTDTFKLFLDKLDSAIDIDLLGQSMSVEGVGGLGSQDKAGERVRSDYKRFDAKTLDACIREQGLYWFTVFNYGDGDLTPVVEHQVDPPEDEKDEALTLQEIGAALDALAAHGADTREIMDRFGIPLLELEDIAADELDNPAPAADPNSPPPGEGAPTDGAPVEQPVMNRAIALRSSVSTRKRSPAAEKRAGLYATRLAAKTRVRAQRALAGYFGSIKAAVDGATSYDDMRARLLKSFKGFDPKALEKLLTRASVMAELSGRKDLLEAI